jgi:Beta-xylosidase
MKTMNLKRNAIRFLSAALAVLLMLPAGLAGAASGGSGHSDAAAVSTSATGAMSQAAVPLNDIEGHWAEADILKWQDKRLVQGYADSTFKPNRPVSRAEFAVLVNRIYQYKELADNPFTDVAPTSGYDADVRKAVAAGYMNGYPDGTFRPNDAISRQEAAVALAAAFGIEPAGGTAAALSDVDTLPAWSKGAVLALIGQQFVSGYPDGSFKPRNPITRAEAVRLLDNISGEIWNRAGVVDGVATRNAVIGSPNVILKNAVIEGDLYLTEGIGEGDVTLDNVTVKGTLRVAGGGTDSVYINDSSIAKAFVNKKNGSVRLVVNGNAGIGELLVLSGARLEEGAGLTGEGYELVVIGAGLPADTVIELSGRFGRIVSESLAEYGLKLLHGTVGQLVIGGNVKLHVEDGTSIADLLIESDVVIVITGLGSVNVNAKSKTKPEFRDKPLVPMPVYPGNPSESEEPDKPAPTFGEASVHDPSIIKDGDTYYVFGTHIEAAKSTDLRHWTRFTNGYVATGNALFGDLSANLAESFAWAGEDDADSKGGFAIWAPDVMWNPDYLNEDGTKGAYLMYYSASSTYIRSAIGIAAARHIEGPYEYVDTIVYSGFTRQEAYDADSDVNKIWTNTNIPQLIEDGVLEEESAAWFNGNGSYRNSVYPNAIDATLFYDADGKLYMTYGSWSGGIFLLEIDKETGRPIYPGTDGTTEDGRLIDRYFGTKIAGGFGKSGEGPYIRYDEKSGFYYLNVTYGWLGADGGYNMRLFRAESPEGPYVDASGQNAVLPTDTANDPYGNKLMGNFLFERKIGEPGEGAGVGYVSPGHNSLYFDEATGQKLLVFHTRFPGRGEAHEVRVHQLFMNEDGWLVAAPYRYAGEKLAKVSEAQLAGDYQWVDHGKSYSEAVEKAKLVRLNRDRTISGDVTGSWRLVGDYYAELTTGGQVYKGVFLKQWNPVSRNYDFVFTVLSDQGVSIWGSKLRDRTDKQLVQDVLNDIDLGNLSAVVSDLHLPAEGARYSQIEWQTSDPSVVTAQGVITRPESDAEPASATLTATVTKGTESGSRTFAVTLLPYQKAELTAHYAFENDLSEKLNKREAGTVTGSRIDNAGGKLTYAPGRYGQAAVFDGGSGVRLPDGLIEGGSYSVALWVNPQELNTYTTTFFGAKDNTNWISLLPQGPAGNQTMLWSGSAVWYDAVSGMTIAAGEWSHLSFTVENGTVKLYVNGELKFTGNGFPNLFDGGGVFALGVNWWDTPFKGLMDELRVYEGILTPKEIRELVFDTELKVEGISLGFAEKRVSVGRTFAPQAVAITPEWTGNRQLIWSSDNESVAVVDASSGIVTGVSAGSATITATAADGGGATASYMIHVVEGPVAHYKFDGDLSDETGLAGGTVTGNRADNTGGAISFADRAEGQAAVFDGNSGIRLPNGLISGGVYTVAMSVYLDRENQFTPAFFGAASPERWISLVPRGPGETQPTMLWSGTAWYDASTGTSMPLNQWVDIAFVVNNGQVTVYLDGEAKFAGTGFPNVFTTDNALFALGVNYWDTPFKGMIDELRIYDAALSAEEIRALPSA